MTMKRTLPLLVLLNIALLTGCISVRTNFGGLKVHGGTTHIYECPDGSRITARYYRLSDDSLQFVKLTMPDGRKYTLPQAASGSGARYTDDRELVWWIKGDTAMLQTRDENGERQIRHQDCQLIDGY
jgi:membrane-bound inhibitor of C-type lysozyme